MSDTASICCRHGRGSQCDPLRSQPHEGRFERGIVGRGGFARQGEVDQNALCPCSGNVIQKLGQTRARQPDPVTLLRCSARHVDDHKIPTRPRLRQVKPCVGQALIQRPHQAQGGDEQRETHRAKVGGHQRRADEGASRHSGKGTP